MMYNSLVFNNTTFKTVCFESIQNLFIKNKTTLTQ